MPLDPPRVPRPFNREGFVPALLSREHIEFIEKAPFAFVMSGGPAAAPDVSPRGDGPGFVRVVDDRWLHLPDRIGNNRIDTIRNVIAEPRVALVFIIPHDQRALYVKGTAAILTDQDVLCRFIVNNRLPRSVMEISVTWSELRETPVFGASSFWVPTGDVSAVPTIGAILADQVRNMTKEAVESLIAESYTNRLY